MLDGIRGSGRDIINGALLEKETYQRAKACMKVEPLESDASWNGRQVVVKPSKYPPGHIWFVAVSPTSLEKTIEKTFRGGQKETVHAKVTATQAPPSKLTVRRPTNEEVNFVVEGEISGFIQKLSAEGMSNDLQCLNCELKVLGGYQQIHEREGRNCSQTGVEKKLETSTHFFQELLLVR